MMIDFDGKKDFIIAETEFIGYLRAPTIVTLESVHFTLSIVSSSISPSSGPRHIITTTISDQRYSKTIELQVLSRLPKLDAS